jgi:hypothetical protein
MTTDFTPPVLEYLLVQGDTFRDGFFVTEYNDVTQTQVPKNISSARIDVTVKTRMDKDAEVLANVNTVDGGVVVINGAGTNDYFEFNFSDVQTNEFPVRKIFMDVQFKFPNEDSITYLKAEIEVSGQATPVQ